MGNVIKDVSITEKVFACLFSLFFVAQILSPSINDKTLYLEWIIAFINPFFWKWLLPIKITERNIWILLLLLSIGAVGHALTSIKIFLDIYSALFLMYMWQRSIWYVNSVVYLSIILSLIQLALMAISMEMAIMLGPSSISKSIWGGYATQTFTNFYDAMGWGLPRTSGLSREAGFLASLVLVCVVHRIVDCQHRKLFIHTPWIYTIGFFTSLSKMSFVLIPTYIIVKMYKWLNKIPSIYIVFMFISVLFIFGGEYTDFLNEQQNVTFLSRFGAYNSLHHLEMQQLLFGEEHLNKIGGISAINEFYGENSYAGLGGWIINNGVIVFILFIAILWWLGITSAGILLMFLLTINVQPDTNQNFVVYTWFICIRYFSKWCWWDNNK